MSGHNKWTKIKHKKAAEDKGRSKLFSKLANEISIAARLGADPQFNPSLRGAVDRARRQNMPRENIERAIKKASSGGDLDSLLIEAYGPEGVGIVIEAATDNRNRTINEIKTILKRHDSRLAEKGSLMWSFEKRDGGYAAKFDSEVSSEAREKVFLLRDELSEMGDVSAVYVSIKKI